MIAYCQSLIRKFWHLLGGGGARGQGVELDPEIRDVFFTELSDLTQALNQAFPKWKENPADQAALQTIRRAFHTLRGSGPIVGAHALGDFCGHIENLTVRVLEKSLSVTPELTLTIDQAIKLLPAFAGAVRDARPAPLEARALGARAQKLLGA